MRARHPSGPLPQSLSPISRDFKLSTIGKKPHLMPASMMAQDNSRSGVGKYSGFAGSSRKVHRRLDGAGQRHKRSSNPIHSIAKKSHSPWLFSKNPAQAGRLARQQLQSAIYLLQLDTGLHRLAGLRHQLALLCFELVSRSTCTDVLKRWIEVV